MAKKQETFYLITYRDTEKNEFINLKAKTIADSSLGLGFIKISDFIFDTNSIVLKPTEEHLKKRFENTKSLHLNLYSIVSIEEIGLEHKGLHFQKDRSNLVMFSGDFTKPPK